MLFYGVCEMAQKQKIIALIDGYNLYHGINDLSKARNSPHLKWVSMQKLLRQFTDPNASEIEKIIFFTAPDPYNESRVRQAEYINTLKAENVIIIEGKFLPKSRLCSKCGSEHETYEEKKTDVNISVAIMRAAYEKEYDTLLLVTADTDITPAIQAAQMIHPQGRIRVIFPPYRGNYELREYLNKRNQIKKIKEIHLKESLLPAEIKLESGYVVKRPEKYNPPNKLPNGD